MAQAVDLELLRQLCLARGVSGREEEVRGLIYEQVKDYAACRTDNLGNLIVEKKGAKRDRVRLMLSANMDEVGFIITHVTKEGYLKFASVGGVDPRVAFGRSVLVGDRCLPGVIGVKPIHLLKGGEEGKVPPLDEQYIDIGAQDEAQALQYVQPGDIASFTGSFLCENGVIQAKALDDRAGCAVLIGMIRSPLPYDMTFCFTVQEETGLKGAKTAAYSVRPQAALVVESTTAADIPSVAEEKQVCRLGKGAVLSFMDRSTLYDREYYLLTQQAARAAGVKWQPKQAVAGGNDAGAIHVSRGGVRTAAVSLPCRYLHSAVGMIACDDLEAVAQTVREAACRIAAGEGPAQEDRL